MGEVLENRIKACPMLFLAQPGLIKWLRSSGELSSLPGCHGDTRAPSGTETRAHRTGKAR